MRIFHVVGKEGQAEAEGVMFSDDQIAVAWKAMISAVTVYQNIEAFKLIHGGEGQRIVFVDNE